MVTKNIRGFIETVDKNIDSAINSANACYKNNSAKILSLGRTASAIMAQGEFAQMQLSLYVMTMIEEQEKQIAAFEKEIKKVDNKLAEIKREGNDVEGAKELVNSLKKWEQKFSKLDVPETVVTSAGYAKMPTSVSIIINKWSNFTLDPNAIKKEKRKLLKSAIEDNKKKLKKETDNYHSYEDKLHTKENNYIDDIREIESNIIKSIMDVNSHLIEKYAEKLDLYSKKAIILKEMSLAFFKGKYENSISEIDVKINSIEEEMAKLNKDKISLFNSRAIEIKKLDETINDYIKKIKTYENKIADLEKAIKENEKALDIINKELGGK